MDLKHFIIWKKNLEMINNKSVEWVVKKPFKIFSIPNFLNDKFYSDINTNFPNFEDIKKENFFKFENNKFAITSGSQEYNKIILQNRTLLNFHNLINSKDFKKIFFFNLYMQIISSRNFNLKHFYKVLKIPKFVEETDNNFFLKNFSIFSKYKITIQYSYILNQGKIVPHPDAGDKILTLLLFFPQYYNHKLYNKKEFEYGTTFWKKDFKNINDKHLKTKNEIENFKKNSSILFQTNFIKNNLFGFFKNDYSWHSVEPVDVKNNYVRKSININIYY